MSMGGLGAAGGDTPAPSFPKLSKGRIAVVIGLMLVRLAAGLLLILFMLSLVPKNPGDPIAYPIGVGIVGIVIYALFFRRQVKSVYKSRYPTLRAMEALILVAAMFLAIFTMVYVMESISNPEAFTEPLDSFTGYYFSLTVLATVGFGDITPTTVVSRSTTMVQMALDIAFLAVVIKVMGSAARRALQQRAMEQSQADEGSVPATE